MSSLEDALKFAAFESSPWKGQQDGAAAAVAALKATRPSAAGLTWLAVPSKCVRLAYRVAADGCTIEAIRILSNEIIKLVGSTTMFPSLSNNVAAAGVVHLACSPDGRLVAAATADGSLRCFDAFSSSESGAIQLQERWVLPNIHSHVVSDLNATPSSSRLAAASASGPVKSLQFNDSYTLLLLDAGGGQKGLALIQADSSNPVIQRPLPSTEVSCASWEPTSAADSDQAQQQQQQHARLVVGDASGKMHIYRHEKFNALTEISSLDFPRDEDAQGWSCTHLDWFTPTSIAAGYCRIEEEEDEDSDDEEEEDDPCQHEVEMFILDFDDTTNLTNPTNVSPLGDVVPFFSVPKGGRHVFYTSTVPTNDSHAPLLLVASNVASDVAVVSKEDDNNDWQIIEVPEGNNVTCPTDEDDEFTFSIGVGLVPRGGSSDPAVLLASTDGSLACFHAQYETNESFFSSSTSGTTTMLPSTPVEAIVSETPPTTATATAATPPAAATEAEKPTATSSSSSIFGSSAAATSFGAGMAAPSFGSAAAASSSGGFSFGAAAATTTTTDQSSKPGGAIFGMTSSLGPKSSPSDKPEAVSTPTTTTSASGPVFGSGSKAPSFSFASSPSPGGGGGFAALAATAGDESKTTAFGGSSPAAAASSSQFNIFGSSSATVATSGLSSMAKPLFGGESSTPAPAPASSAFGGATFSLPDVSKPLFASPAPAPAPAPSSAFGGASSSTTKLSTPLVASAPAPDPSDPFGTKSPSSAASGLTSMAKPLFGTSSAAPSTATTDSKATSDATTTTTTKQPWSAALKPAGSGFSFGAGASTSAAATTAADGSTTPELSKSTTLAEQTETTPGDVPKQPPLDSMEAKKAAQVFDSFDPSKTGIIPRDKLDDLLEELGEGFYGQELEEQVVLMDPEGSGQLKRSSFIDWYVKLSQNQGDKDDDDNSSMDSDERAEREEEAANCRENFSALSKDGKTIKSEDFPKLIESFGTTYCEDGAHGRAQKNLSMDGVIELDDFIAWYLDWFFGEDDESDDEENDEEQPSSDTTLTSTTGWGNMFSAKAGSWKCESCMVRNDDPNATKCVSCGTQREGTTATPGEGTNNDGASTTIASSSSIGPGGFTFGGSTGVTATSDAAGSKEAKDESKSAIDQAPSTGIGKSGFSFAGGFGSEPSATTGSSITPGGGFSFGAPASSQSSSGGTKGFVFSSTTASASSAPEKDTVESSSPGKKASDVSEAKSGSTVVEVVQDVPLDSVEAKSAARAFDSVDISKTGVVGNGDKPASGAAPSGGGFSFGALSTGTTFGAPGSSGSGLMFGKSSQSDSTSTKATSKAASSSAYPPLSSKAPAPVDAPKATSSSAYPPLSSKAPAPVEAAKPTTSSSGSAYPPMSRTAPKPVETSSKASATSAYPPMSKAAPKPVETTKAVASSSYPPMSKAAPKPVVATKATASSSYPPMSKAAPKPVVATKATASSSYPPMSRTAPKPVEATKPTAKAPASASSSGYPPISAKAPAPIGAPAPASASAYPPIAAKAPKPFGAPAPTTAFGSTAAPPSFSTGAMFGATGSSSAGSGFSFGQAASGAKIPSPFGPPKASSNSAYPPLSTKAPAPVDAPKAAATSAYPPISKAVPTPLGAPKATGSSSSAYPPMSKVAPKAVPVGAPGRTPAKTIKPGMPLSTGRTGPASALPRSVPPKDESLSDCAAEYTRLVAKMQESLDRVAPGVPDGQENELRSAIEDLVHGVKTVLTSFGENNASLADCKRTAAVILSKTDGALRRASETQRLIDDQKSNGDNDFLEVQPLDASSEKLQRVLAAHGILFDRYLSLVRDKSLFVDQLRTPDAQMALARALVVITPKVKGFDDETKKMEDRCRKLSSPQSEFLLSPAKSVTTLATRRGNKAVATTARSTTTFSRRLLHLDSSSFDEIRSSHVKSFGLDRKLPKSSEKPKRRLLAADTVAAQSPARGVQLGSLQQHGSSGPIFSPPEPAQRRSGWDKISKVDQTRSKQVSFSSPKELREISLDSAARDALSSFGTTPEKVQGAIAIQNRKDTPAVPKRPGSSKPLPTSTPAPLESSGSRHRSQQSSSAGVPSSFPSNAADGSRPSSSALLPSFSSGTAKTSAKNAAKPTDTGLSKSSSTVPADTAKSGSAFGSMASLGSSSLFSTSTENRAGSTKTAAEPKGKEAPDYAAILATFYQTHNPAKVGDAKKMVEKYRGREVEMFMKLGKKYNVPSPLETLKDSTTTTSSSAPTASAASNLSTPSLSAGPAPPASTPFSSEKPPLAPSPFASAATPAPTASTNSPFGSPSPSMAQSTFGSSAPAFGSPPSSSLSAGFPGITAAPAPAFGKTTTPGPAPAFGSPATPAPAPAFGNPSTPAPAFGSAAKQSPFGGGSLTGGSPSPFGAPAPAPASANTFGGRSPRELLTAFYQQYNSAKVAEVDKLLAKYQGKEEHMFRQLAKKYNLDPSIFGLSAAPAAATPGFASPSPGGFGQPAVLGGGPAFGGAASSSSPFGGASASPGGFGQPAVLGGGPVGTPAVASSFGSASGAAFGAGASFGSLAHSPGAATAGGFGSSPAAPFGTSTPFGAPRR